MDIGNWNKLLALAFKASNELGFEVWFWKGCGLDQCFASTFGIVAKFPQWNLATFYLIFVAEIR